MNKAEKYLYFRDIPINSVVGHRKDGETDYMRLDSLLQSYSDQENDELKTALVQKEMKWRSMERTEDRNNDELVAALIEKIKMKIEIAKTFKYKEQKNLLIWFKKELQSINIDIINSKEEKE